MEEYLKKIGTNFDALNHDIKGEPRTEEGKDKFLREKYEDTLKGIQLKQEVAKTRQDTDKLEELEKQEQEVKSAYQKIKSEALRNQLDNMEQGDSKKRVFKEKNPYRILNILKEKVEELPGEEQDQYIEKRKKELLDYYQKDLEGEKNFSKKLRIELRMKEIEEAYEKIATAEKREEYNKQEQKERKNHADEYNPYLINDLSNSDHESLQGKMVTKEKVLAKEYAYEDRENRQLRIKQTGRIKFQNWTGVGELSINEYEVRRIIDGQEKVDTIYTNLSNIDLSMDEERGEPTNPDYYDCFANKLLAEDTIEASKYNGGFIGGIEKNQKGKYYLTLENNKLLPMEQEQMTAVIIMEQKEKKIEKEGDEQTK